MIASNLFLLLLAGFFATIYGLMSLIRALRKNAKIAFIDLILVFMMALLPLVAVVNDNRANTQFGLIEIGSAILGIGMIIGGIVVMLLELRRPDRLKQSRGILGMGTGILLLVMIFITFNTARVQLQAELASLPTPTAGATQTFEELGEVIFTDILNIISQETGGLAEEFILEQLDAGVTLRQLINDNGGNVEVVVQGLTDTMTGYFKQLAAEGRIEATQATAAIGSMGFFVRLSLDRDFSGFLEQLEQGGGAVNRTPLPAIQTERAILALTATSTITATAEAVVMLTSTPPATATSRPPVVTFTPIAPTRTPIVLATPAPLSTFLITPTQTPNPDNTATPTISAPTSAIPCLVVMNFNVNLRETPTTDGRILVSIPFETTVFGIGRNADSTWWQVQYEDLSGWVFADIVTVTSTCRNLPIIE
ncbi:MAG: SH3 domain-containing protein [bacterium]|nr:SH3 domain-containing protein [bacterium]